jgi:hypothetical protein
MPYVIKTDARSDFAENQIAEAEEKCRYGGNAVEAGDTIYIWFSGASKRLAWLAEALRVRHVAVDQAAVSLRLISRSSANAPTLETLIPFRDTRDGSVLDGLSFKLYRNSLNKVALLAPAEAAYLRGFFP